MNVTNPENSGPRRERPKALTIQDDGDGVVRLIGELDMDTAPMLRRLFDRGGVITVLDLGEVTFIDSSGLSVLMLVNRERPTSEPLTLRSPSLGVCRVLEITGLLEMFRIDPGYAPS